MHLIEVLYDDVAVPKSPFRVSVVEGCDPTRVRAYGPGLEGGVTNKANCFTVETRCWPGSGVEAWNEYPCLLVFHDRDLCCGEASTDADTDTSLRMLIITFSGSVIDLVINCPCMLLHALFRMYLL